ncbi:glycoside hydrolase family 10 protein [Maledivibacter halophilus]|uniref:Uncharacterized lipoprotein YddW, UPF0748 family n=1 Tax=Maledivibacter halophilus TaxID=36842 RepID=A0A1T5L8S0_9FIRM|nr:family 10 glycosylhydrolase [Maledivibacter halophilus]SKC72095.1 Uncharacterized lipoprotein YddW, UPF0748 family [Maledivibacter halophilus]
MLKGIAAKSIIFLSIIFMLIVPVYALNNVGKTDMAKESYNEISADGNIQNNNSQKKELRAIWVATIYGLDYPSKEAIKDVSLLKKEMIEIIDNVEEMGFNTIYFQVRPAADAFYSSKIFPWSKYLTGDQTISPQDNFDPLEFIVKQGHERNIEVHAWINPYRITMQKSDLDELAPNHPALLHPEWVVAHGSGDNTKHYFNPGIPEVEQMILEGVSEIIENYNVDGIHLDDYFYPGTNFNDHDTYAKYGSKYDNIGDWRRSNINSLIEKMYHLIKAKDENLSFGVSPFAIWANKSSNPLGSDTKGKEAYYTMYADTRGWVKAGYLDYIIPQIYWNIGYEIADYEKLLNWWADVVADTDVDLYVGQAAYRAGNPDPNSPWYGINQIKDQVDLNRRTNNVKGYVMFRYKSLLGKPELVNLMKYLNRLVL